MPGGGGGAVSDSHPECPVVVPSNCPDYRHPRICALVRGDRRCLHRPGGHRRGRICVALGEPRPAHRPEVLRNPETRAAKGTTHFHTRVDRGWRELD